MTLVTRAGVGHQLRTAAAAEAVSMQDVLKQVQLAPGFNISQYYNGVLPSARSLALSGAIKAGGPVITYLSSSTEGKVRGLHSLCGIYDAYNFIGCKPRVPVGGHQCACMAAVAPPAACGRASHHPPAFQTSRQAYCSRSLHYTPPLPLSKVWALVDSNGDGTAEQATALLSGWDTPVGIAWGNGSLYVAHWEGGTSTPQGMTGGIAVIDRLDDVDSYALEGKVRWCT